VAQAMLDDCAVPVTVVKPQSKPQV
jgi:hypothetical protein